MRRLKKLLKFASMGAGCLMAGSLAWSVFETAFYRRALPEGIKTSGLATTGSDFAFFTIFLPLRHEACGGAIHKLTDETRSAIERRGLAFFEGARHGRGYPPGHPRNHYYSYKPWHETPVPHAWTSEGIWIGLHCMKLSSATLASIRQAALRPGAYYSTKDEAEILVIPSLGIVVFTYFG